MFGEVAPASSLMKMSRWVSSWPGTNYSHMHRPATMSREMLSVSSIWMNEFIISQSGKAATCQVASAWAFKRTTFVLSEQEAISWRFFAFLPFTKPGWHTNRRRYWGSSFSRRLHGTGRWSSPATQFSFLWFTEYLSQSKVDSSEKYDISQTYHHDCIYLVKISTYFLIRNRKWFKSEVVITAEFSLSFMDHREAKTSLVEFLPEYTYSITWRSSSGFLRFLPTVSHSFIILSSNTYFFIHYLEGFFPLVTLSLHGVIAFFRFWWYSYIMPCSWILVLSRLISRWSI